MSSIRVREPTLQYPEHQLKPEDLLHFVALDEFMDDWNNVLELNEDDLWALELLIMSMPSGPPVISGTAGLRKLRFAPEKWGQGKRGAARILHVYFEEYWLVLLVKAYRKNEKDSLSGAEKNGIKKYIAATEQWLKKAGGNNEA